MKIEIIGNPGTGNTFSESIDNHVENNYHGPTTINYYGKDSQRVRVSSIDEKESVKAEILTKLKKLEGFVLDKWKAHHESLWKAILAIPEVDKVIYNPGRQKNTTFNRNLLANIICLLCSKEVYDGENRSDMAREFGEVESFRKALGQSPANEKIYTSVEKVVKEYEQNEIRDRRKSGGK